VPIVFALIGFYRFSWLPTPTWRDDRSDPLYRPYPHEVCFRIVSRGTNPLALARTVETVYAEMKLLPLFPWTVEVVCDVDPGLAPRRGLQVLVVPDDYATQHGSLFKARALNYALDVSGIEETTWLLHLDEESRITPSLIRGVRDAIVEEEESGRLRIGQGAILYHGHLNSHTNLTLADMIRTGDDVSRFHFQHRLGVTVFGLHGSFILVRSDVEMQVSFDVGPEGSITEDAFWALRQMAVGNRIRWVDGFLSEQSPQSVTDFVKQRRRWFSGLTRCVLYADAPLWCRIPLAAYLGFWSLAWISMLYTILNLVLFGFRTPPVVAGLADFSFAGYAMFYALGLWLNLRDKGGTSRTERFSLYASLVVLFPAYIVVEAIGVVLGMVRPDKGFHVVEKQDAAA
jgi:egghead protein (zeste-white 4 protein)